MELQLKKQLRYQGGTQHNTKVCGQIHAQYEHTMELPTVHYVQCHKTELT